MGEEEQLTWGLKWHAAVSQETHIVWDLCLGLEWSLTRVKERKNHPVQWEENIARQSGTKRHHVFNKWFNFILVWLTVQRRWVFESKDKVIGRSSWKCVVHQKLIWHYILIILQLKKYVGKQNKWPCISSQTLLHS